MGSQLITLILFCLLSIHLQNVFGMLPKSSSGKKDSTEFDTVSLNWVTVSQVLNKFSREFEDFVGVIANDKEPNPDEADAKLKEFVAVKLGVSTNNDQVSVNIKDFIIATYVAYYAVEYQLSFTLCHAQYLTGGPKYNQLFVPPVDKEVMSRCEKLATSLHKLSFSYREVLRKIFASERITASAQSPEEQKSEEKPDLPSSSSFGKRSLNDADEAKLIENLHLESPSKTLDRKQSKGPSFRSVFTEVTYRELSFFRNANSKENLNFNKALNILLNYIYRMSNIQERLVQLITDIKGQMKKEKQSSSDSEITDVEVSNTDVYSKIAEYIYKSVSSYRNYLRKYFSSINVDEGLIDIHRSSNFATTDRSDGDERQLVTMHHFIWITASKILDRSFSMPLKKSSSSSKLGVRKLKKTRSLLPEESSLKLLSLCEEVRSLGFVYFLYPGFLPTGVNPLQLPSYPDFSVEWNDNNKGAPDFKFLLLSD